MHRLDAAEALDEVHDHQRDRLARRSVRRHRRGRGTSAPAAAGAGSGQTGQPQPAGRASAAGRPMPTMVSSDVTRSSMPLPSSSAIASTSVVRRRDDPARRVALVEGHVEALEVDEDPAAQVEQHVAGRPGRSSAGRRPGWPPGAPRRASSAPSTSRSARDRCRRTAAAGRRSRCRPAPGAAPTGGRRSPRRPRCTAAGPPAGAARAGQPAAAGCGCAGAARRRRGGRRRSPWRRRARSRRAPCRPRRPRRPRRPGVRPGSLRPGTTSGGVRASAGRRARAHRAASASSSSAASRWR